jgi:hypothetical protein
MVRSSGFGSVISDRYALLRLVFTLAPVFTTLTLPLTTSRRLILQQARRQTLKVVLLLLVSLRFHVLFHSPPGVLFTFPSRYSFTIGYSVVFSLTRWSSWIHTGFHVPHATRDRIIISLAVSFRLQDFHFLGFSIPTNSSNLLSVFLTAHH